MAQQMQTRTRTNRQATPERWQAALARAFAEGVTVRQVNDNGMWVASSGTDATMAYLLEITNGVAHRCTCKAGEFGDAICKHRAMYYYLAGLLDPEPEGSPPASAVAPVVCFRCQGREDGCPVCAGAGLAALAAQAAALVAAVQAAEGRAVMVAEPDPAPFDAEPSQDVEYVGRAGHIAGYDVLMAGDSLLVTHAATGSEWRHVVPNFGTALADLAQAPGLRLGWARFPDDAEAIYCYDAEDGCFGYALNLSDPALSEWGYAPFVAAEDRVCDHCGGPLDDEAATDAALQTICGACVERSRREAEAARAAAITEAHASAAWERAQLAA